MVSGFVQSVHGLIIASKHVVLAKVRHSQKVNDPTVPLWIIIEDDGRILCAHCHGCMAGQGETCSHIASVLFYIETFNRIRGMLACTDKRCVWILPAYSKDIPFAEVQNIDFRSAKKLKQKLDETVEKLFVNAPCFVPEDSKTTEKQERDIQAPTEAEVNSFYEKLNTSKKKLVALSLIYPYSESFVTKSRTVQAVPDLFDMKYLNTQYNELLEICAEVNIEITPEQVKIIEEDSRKQSSCHAFFRHRARRIGASISKQACQTNPAQPYHSVIKTVRYPHIFRFSNAATEHGCKHEKQALAAYELAMKERHVIFKVKECRMFVNQEYPWLHATPDFLCSCDCCGEVCGEIKCPYCLKELDFQAYLCTPGSCLSTNMTIKEDHQYCYELQQQLFTTGKKYNDFIVCTIKENIAWACMSKSYPNQQQWDTVLPKLTNFWRFCVLPEILGRWYTQKRDITLKHIDAGAVCLCRNETGEAVVHFSNTACPISFYHLSCPKLMGVPKNWRCPLCPKGSPSQKQKRPSISDDTTICICNQNATTSDKRIKCHNNPCMNGKFFHFTCMNYKRKPNNAKTTWICPNCSAANLYDTKSKIKVANSDNVKASACHIVSTPNNGNLNNCHFKRILSPTGWLDDDIILEVHINLKKIDPTMQGLRDPILGPVRQFRRVGNPFVQILYTGNYHWVCISSVGCSDGIVNLYDSLYHNVISKKVEEQAINLVGAGSFLSLNVVPIQ